MVPFETIDKLYRGVVLPALDYCDVVWHGCTKSASNKLEVVHNNAARTVLWAPYRSSATQLRSQLGWTTLGGERRDYHLAIWVYNQPNTHQHETRNCHGLYVPRPRTNILKRSFAYQGVLIWNSLPDNVRSA